MSQQDKLLVYLDICLTLLQFYMQIFGVRFYVNSDRLINEEAAAQK